MSKLLVLLNLQIASGPNVHEVYIYLTYGIASSAISRNLMGNRFISLGLS